MTIESRNPATGEVFATYSEMSTGEWSQVVDRVEHAYLDWRETSFDHRAKLLKAAGESLRKRRIEIGELMTLEMGKPITESYAEIDKCAGGCDYYAENGADFLSPEVIETDARRSFVAFEPVGPVLAVMPWNFPLWQVFRFAAPALMAGNTTVLKHASNVPGSALAIEATFRDAGFPDDCFRTLLIGSSEVAEVIARPQIRAVTLTGSTPAGRAVASAAGRHLKKTVLELGGSDPYLLLEDADLEQAVDICVTSRLINNGQSCIAAKRFIVPRSLLDEFESRFVDKMSAQVVGDPLDEKSDIGPLAREDLRDELHDQVERSVAAGAKCLLGGKKPERKGAWYPPTVLTDVGPGMPAYDEELFGPVAAILPVDDEEEGISIANDSAFGLGAAVFTSDLERGEQVATKRLEAGACFVNAFVRSDPRLPFGGIKASGYGRELGRFGIREFVNIKTVYVG
ncbi:MAG: NAD-dependent succinate-semialdehyde dehydrogenase [Acidobacteriota bacterium]